MLYNQDWEIKIEVNPTAKLLLDAADLMERHGHCKNSLRTAYGEMCFMGALYAADGQEMMIRYTLGMELAVNAMMKFLDLSRDPRGVCMAVVAWNNAPERTKDEVVSAMRAAARAL